MRDCEASRSSAPAMSWEDGLFPALAAKTQDQWHGGRSRVWGTFRNQQAALKQRWEQRQHGREAGRVDRSSLQRVWNSRQSSVHVIH